MQNASIEAHLCQHQSINPGYTIIIYNQCTFLINYYQSSADWPIFKIPLFISIPLIFLFNGKKFNSSNIKIWRNWRSLPVIRLWPVGSWPWQSSYTNHHIEKSEQRSVVKILLFNQYPRIIVVHWFRTMCGDWSDMKYKSWSSVNYPTWWSLLADNS